MLGCKSPASNKINPKNYTLTQNTTFFNVFVLYFSDMNMQKAETCREKMSFEQKTQAQTAATVAAHQRGIKLKPYLCRLCDLWHNTTDYED